MAFTFKNLKDLLEAYSQRKRHGIKPIWCVNHGPTISMYYRDPDGNVLETQIDVFETLQETFQYVKSPEFLENPIGVDFDPEDWINRLREGENEKTVCKRPSIGPRGFESNPLE